MFLDLSLVDFSLVILVLLAGLYMSWNIGANDVANAIGTSVGSKALTMKKAVIMAAILEFAGAALLGSNVSETLQKGIISPEIFSGEPLIFVLGMISSLIATAIWLQIASMNGWPVSTTHAIVGAILGFGMVVGGFYSVQWDVVLPIVASWIISPLLSGIVAYLIFVFIQKRILFSMDPVKMSKHIIPGFVFLMILLFIMGTCYHSISHYKINPTKAFIGALSLSVFCSLLAMQLIRSYRSPICPELAANRDTSKQILQLTKAAGHLSEAMKNGNSSFQDELNALLEKIQNLKEEISASRIQNIDLPSSYATVEKMFGGLQILSAAFVAFAHGANDVANAIGPVAAALNIILYPGAIMAQTYIPTWILLFGGLGIVLGVTTWGWRVIETIGKKITELSPTRGFCAELGAAVTILFATKIGLPISTTHCIVGAVLGVGLARGFSALNLRTAGEIAISWVVTIPSSMIASIVTFWVMKWIFLS